MDRAEEQKASFSARRWVLEINDLSWYGFLFFVVDYCLCFGFHKYSSWPLFTQSLARNAGNYAFYWIYGKFMPKLFARKPRRTSAVLDRAGVTCRFMAIIIPLINIVIVLLFARCGSSWFHLELWDLHRFLPHLVLSGCVIFVCTSLLQTRPS